MLRTAPYLLGLVLLLVAPGYAAAPGVAEPTRTALDARDELIAAVDADLGGLAAAIQARDFKRAAEAFTPGFSGEAALGGDAAVDRSCPLFERTRWKRKAKPERVDAAGCLAPLSALLSTWKQVDHAELTVQSATFQDADGRIGAAAVELGAAGRDAGGRAVALALTWDLCLRRDQGRCRLDCLTARAGTLDTGTRELFTDATAAAGLAGVVAPTTGPAVVGRGVAVCDVDGDGIADVFLPGPNGGLFRGTGGGAFLSAGQAIAEGTACLAVDLDGDGDDDLVVALAGKPEVDVLENTGDGFVLHRLDSGAPVTALVATDFDGDGKLDLYACCAGDGVPKSRVDAADSPPNRLWLQTGALAFRECAKERGVADTRWSMAAAATDADGDGDVDLFVANAHGPDAYFENDGSGHFTDRAAELGLADRGDARGADWGDWDGDGQPDVWVAGNGLYVRRRGHFEDARRRSGTATAGSSWGGGFVDFDNDGRLDLFAVNGCPPGKARLVRGQRDALFWNAGTGKGLDVSALSGADDAGEGRGVAFLDADRDGDTDLLVHDSDGARLFRNEIGAAAGWLRLELVGTESNRAAVGSRVRVHTGPRTLTRAIACGSGFASSSERALTIGLGSATTADAVDVYWPSGVIEHFGPFPARTAQRLVEGYGEVGPAKSEIPSPAKPHGKRLGAGKAEKSGPRR